MKNDFTEIIAAGMQSLLSCVEGRDMICIRIFRNEWNSCSTPKNLHLGVRETLLLCLYKSGTFSSSITRICQIILICSYLLIFWKEYAWVTTLTSTAIIRVFILCEFTGLISSEVSFIFLIHITFNCDLHSLLWASCRSQRPRGLRCRSSAARLLRSWVRIPPGEWMCRLLWVLCVVR
jgi:hypothetical protein